MSDEPLIWTTKGNVPVSTLRRAPKWEIRADRDNPGALDEVVFVEEWYLGDELVKRSADVLKFKGSAMEGIQGKIGG